MNGTLLDISRARESQSASLDRMSAIRRLDRGNEWWVDFRYRARRIRRRSPIQTKRGAEAFEQQLLAELWTGASAAADSTNPDRASSETDAMTFGTFAEHWMRDWVVPRDAPATQKAKRVALNLRILPAFGELPLADITARHLDAFQASLAEAGLKPKTINNYLAMVSNALRVAVRWDLISHAERVNPSETPAQRIL